MNSKKMAVLWLSVLILFNLIVIVVEVPQPVKAGTIWVDDDYVVEDPTHKKTIQAAVDNSTPGDTVFVYSGTYFENVSINKTINLTGENVNTTIINGTDDDDIIYVSADWVNITGFTIIGNDSHLYDAGIELNNVQNCSINNINSSMNWAGIYLLSSHNNNIKNITVHNIGLSGRGIRVDNSHMNYFENISVFNNHNGIDLKYSDNNIINNGIIYQCYHGFLIYDSIDNTFLNFSIWSNRIDDLSLLFYYVSYATIINTTFVKPTIFYQTTSEYARKWFLHINVIDYLGNPIPNAQVKIMENNNSSYQEFFTTDNNGHLRWLTVTEYTERDSNGDEVGERTFFTPHHIVAWNDTLVGYAQPFMNESKTVTIILGNGTLMNLEPGWNLVSLPRIQSDTNLQTVLQSIEGQYDAVQWYNITDNNDPWKHNHISKPSNWNDLNSINHTMGLWVHVTDSGGTTLVVFGDVLTSTQNITLYPGWNLVGYPSTTDKIRTVALNNIFFDTDVDAIWTYNATTQKWKEITASDNFEVGRGYWIHSKVTKVWDVPL